MVREGAGHGREAADIGVTWGERERERGRGREEKERKKQGA